MNQKAKKQIIKIMAVIFSATVVFSASKSSTFYAVKPTNEIQTNTDQKSLNEKLSEAFSEDDYKRCIALIEESDKVDNLDETLRCVADCYENYSVDNFMFKHLIFNEYVKVFNFLIDKFGTPEDQNKKRFFLYNLQDLLGLRLTERLKRLSLPCKINLAPFRGGILCKGEDNQKVIKVIYNLILVPGDYIVHFIEPLGRLLEIEIHGDRIVRVENKNYITIK